MANMTKTQFSKLIVTAVAVLSLAGCATAGNGSADAEISDPLEGVNRAVFAVNDAIDQAIGEPIAKGYRAVVPKPARSSVRNELRHLRTPVNAGNQLLQGDLTGVANDLGRFVVNTFMGFGGLFDAAETLGMDYEYEDFGQTLGVWGVDSGPYLVLPILGPSSVRDAAGLIVDAYADPLRLYLYNTDQEAWHYARVGVTYVDKREELIDVLGDLRRNAFDYYATLRSTYHQRRNAQIADENAAGSQYDAIPDYDDEDY